MSLIIVNFFKVFSPSAIAFFIGICLAPFLSDFLYRHRLWKKQSVTKSVDGQPATMSAALHQDEIKKTPRMGGILVWGSVLVTTLAFLIASLLWPDTIFAKLNFLSREQTWLPFFTLIVASLIGLVDDILVTSGGHGKGSYVGGGLSLGWRIGLVLLIGLVGSLWFYFKLETNSIHIPFVGSVFIGLWFIPLFMLVMLGVFSSGVIDGLDGLSGGVMATIFAAYAGIAFFQNQIDIAAFCSVITGATLAFLWFNIPPARFYMSETGMLGLTTTLAVIAFLTDSVLTLPIIALPLVATSLSDIIQVGSKKFRGKKILLIAPLHHHFEAKGWPATKVVMRYWIIGIISAVIGMVVTLIGA